MLTGAPVALRLLAADDRVAYRALWTSPDVMRAIGPPLTPAQADAQFERTLRHNARVTPGHRSWMVLPAAGGGPCGLVALLRHGLRAEVGVMLQPTEQRRGVAAAALRLLLPHAFGPLGLEIVDASRADDAHVAVIDRLLRPLGFERCAGLRPGEAGWRLLKSHYVGGRRPVG